MDEDSFKRILKEKGLKVTNQRLLVLDALAQWPGQHLSVEEIYDLVRENHPEVGLATIYRTVQLLLALEMIEKVNFDDGLVRYELSDEGDSEKKHRHHHLICQRCGVVYPFEEDLLDTLEQAILNRTGFVVQNHEVKLYGYCKSCVTETVG